MPAGADTDLKCYVYPDFGLYLYRSKRLYLAIRCGFGQHLSHAHNDQLSFELSVDGTEWARDLGTYVYTPLPHQRNRYRSVGAHAAPQVEGREPGRLDYSLFWIGEEAKARCVYFTPKEFWGQLEGRGWGVVRQLCLTDTSIRIFDTPLGSGSVRAYLNDQSTLPFSSGYGKLVRKQLPIPGRGWSESR